MRGKFLVMNWKWFEATLMLIGSILLILVMFFGSVFFIFMLAIGIYIDYQGFFRKEGYYEKDKQK